MGASIVRFAKTDELGREVYVFLAAGNYEFLITAWYTDGKMSKIRYEDATEKGWNDAMVKALLAVNAPDTRWDGLETTDNSKETGANSSIYFGSKNKHVAYMASPFCQPQNAGH